MGEIGKEKVDTMKCVKKIMRYINKMGLSDDDVFQVASNLFFDNFDCRWDDEHIKCEWVCFIVNQYFGHYGYQYHCGPAEPISLSS